MNCMSMNLLTPSLRTGKRNKSTFIPFLPRLQDSNFEEVAKKLTAAKALHGIIGDIAVILAEDETRVKPTMRWEARHDTLIGFYGDKDNNVCKMDLEVEVGFGESDHWKGLKQRWDKYCRQAVDPVLGHASDNDARRRKFMLEDDFGSEGQRWTIGWGGWVLFGIVLDSGDVYALGDHDPIHNGKKMINPLDKSSYPIVLGDFHACLEHISCHFVVLLCTIFRDKLPRMALPLHLLDDQITEALKVGLQQAQTLLTQLNMSPHAGMRDKTWWRTPWTLEKELGIFGMSSSIQESDHERFELNDMEEVEEIPNSELSFDLWDIPEANGASSTMEIDVDAEEDDK
ncbi:hypothetical protein R1flu_021282 [Riccia fluitans]|uniref:Uncharacterized protein n=1 Tax=Riccia fluitans TaxID=41844 RepID=A0ABD1ZSB1_9MARC